MPAKSLEKLTVLIVSGVLIAGSLNAFAESKIQVCSLKSEIEPFQRQPPTKPVMVKWGVNTPNFVHLLTDLQAGAPKRVRSLVRALKSACTGVVAANPACKFIEESATYNKVQTQLKSMLADGTFEELKTDNEVVFRAINFSINPLSENASSHAGQTGFLDATNPQTLNRLGLSVKDLTLERAGRNAFELPQILGHVAQSNRFSGVLLDSAVTNGKVFHRLR
jgi:hypothetical protein